MKFRLALGLALISCSLLASPQKANLFNESMNEKVKVSGRFHAGLQVNNTESSNKLFVFMPKEKAKQLCVDITSIDGVYKAEIVYHLQRIPAGYVELEFPSMYKTQLKQYKPMELAIKATIGDTCKDLGLRNVLASWGKHTDARTLLLLIRSDARRDVAYIPSIKHATQKVKCRKLETSYNVAYDKYCLFKDIDPRKVTSIEVERKNLRKIPSEMFELK